MSGATDPSALVDRWRDTYNDDVARMVSDCYAPDCTVYPMGLSPIEGQDMLLRVEQAVLKKAPRRRMRVDRRHVCGNVICVEAVLLDPDQGGEWSLPFAAVLSIVDGRIATDRTYADWQRWPGL
ncbi:MAG: nuclear transport factor 2 family protein [Gammaproteobacteria bacterium]